MYSIAKIHFNLPIWELSTGLLLCDYCFIDDSYDIEYSNIIQIMNTTGISSLIQSSE